MNIIAINGSRRKNGNTSILLQTILTAAEKTGFATETVFLGDYEIDACNGCERCSLSWQCVIDDDYAKLIDKIDKAHGVVLGSPTYWYSVTSDMKRFIDRCYSLIQYPKTRREWIGKYQGTGKLCVTAAVCEQLEEAMMGSTLALLNDFSRDIGLDVVDSVKALGFFEAGSILRDPSILQLADIAGQKLIHRLESYQ